MITGIENVTFKVSDLGRACDFFEQQLGLKVVYRDDKARWAEVDAGALHIGLQQAEPAGGGCNPVVSLRVENLDETVAALRARGVEFASGIISSDAGRSITVRDPDGNQLDLFEPAD